MTAEQLASAVPSVMICSVGQEMQHARSPGLNAGSHPADFSAGPYQRSGHRLTICSDVYVCSSPGSGDCLSQQPYMGPKLSALPMTCRTSAMVACGSEGPCCPQVHASQHANSLQTPAPAFSPVRQDFAGSCA